ncbi:hypothetical protein [Caulobacter sp. NIBR2454]|nr:hypothetical protein [Caulobacter sp. NIBR2454]
MRSMVEGAQTGLSFKPLIPAKAGTQIHPEPQQGFTWAPAFAGVSGI